MVLLLILPFRSLKPTFCKTYTRSNRLKTKRFNHMPRGGGFLPRRLILDKAREPCPYGQPYTAYRNERIINSQVILLHPEELGSFSRLITKSMQIWVLEYKY